MGKDASGENTPGVPSSCSVAYVKIANSTAPPVMTLKFDRPPSWGKDPADDSAVINADIEVYCICTWTNVSDKDAELGLPRSLQEAGLFRACYVATGEERFDRLYTQARNVYSRSGAGNEPRVKVKAGYQTGNIIDWRL